MKPNREEVYRFTDLLKMPIMWTRCRKQQASIFTLQDHCKSVEHVLFILGVSWVIPQTTFQMPNSWKGVGRRKAEEDWWLCIPVCIWWTVCKERISRHFEDRSSDMCAKIKDELP